MPILNKIKTLITPSINTGIAEDTRSPLEKAKDYRWEEFAPVSGALDYTKLPQTSSFVYSVRNQWISNSCVAQSGAKSLEILDKKSDEPWSATPIYQRRVNAPGAGMIGYDVLDIIRKYPMMYEKDCPSQLMSDQEMDTTLIPKIESRGNPTGTFVIGYDNLSFDQIAQSIISYGPVILYVNANRYMWTSVPIPNTRDNSLRHGICAHQVIWDPLTNQPFLVIDDSWGKFDSQPSRFNLAPGQRALSKEFVERHVYFGAGFVNFEYKNPAAVVIPQGAYQFKNQMYFGQKNQDVVKLQNKLKALGLYAGNVPSTGYYGNYTASCVKAFQIRYSVDNIVILNSLGGRTVGPKTLQKLNLV